jgi:hypothetical protein
LWDAPAAALLGDAFAVGVLLPAVRANASLRALVTHCVGDDEPSDAAAREAEALVACRS